MLFQELPSSLESKCVCPSQGSVGWVGNSVSLRPWMRTCESSPAWRRSSQFIYPDEPVGMLHQRQAGREQGVSSEDPTSDLQLLSPHVLPRDRPSEGKQVLI